MAVGVMRGNFDDGYSPQEISQGIDRLHDYAEWGHQLGSLALTDVTKGVVKDETLYGRGRASLPAGYLAVSREIPPMGPAAGYPPVIPGSDNYIG